MPKQDSTARQGSHFWVMTLEIPGAMVSTNYGTYTPPAAWTRFDTFTAIRRELADQQPQMASANVTYFALEPNQL
ncbi:hypothetical protein ABT143_36410 [Streptomyces sp. NPDC002033]|uniref:hypothetical protein n=1 Tax=unclassified Streptomyces TaxID=2593676 RepID=UPI00332BFF08